MLRKSKLATLTLGLLLLSPVALAAMSAPFGWYVEGNAGQSRLQDKSYPGSAKTLTGFGWNVDAGYKFSPYAGGEIGYTRYALTRIKDFSNNYIANDEHHSVHAAAKAMLPLADSGAEIFAKLGIQRLTSKIKVTNPGAAAAAGISFNTTNFNKIGPYLALGLGFAFTPNLSANLQWARANGNSNTGTENLYSAGLSFLMG